ncbi:coiled-coil domain-containing protein 18 isoform 1-T1 [Menidia menidia]
MSICSSQTLHQGRPFSGPAERRAVAGELSPPSCSSQSPSFRAQSAEMQYVSARKKPGCVRQENACLTTLDEQLISDLDVLQCEQATSFSQAHLRGSRMMVNHSMTERIRQLEEDLEAQARELQEAVMRAECCQEAATHSDIVVTALTGELNTLRDELENKIALGKRAEQQRNQALLNAEKFKEAFKDYKATISMKLNKMMESENKLKESLIEFNVEKEELERRFCVLKREKEQLSQTVSQMQGEARQAEATAAKLRVQAEEAGRKALHLEQQLAEQNAQRRETGSLYRELEELRALTRSQEQRVTQSHKEAQQSQSELACLEAILKLLHLREGTVGQLCSSPCMLPAVENSGTSHPLNLKPGEGYQQLLKALQQVEAERLKQSSLNERLQEGLSRAKEEISSLQSSMAQRASHYHDLHTELMNKVSRATDTEKELKRKTARVAALEKQLQEKTSAYSLAALKNTELENQLDEKSSTLQHYQSLMSKKQREFQQTLEKCKQSQSQQLIEQKHRIEMLQLSMKEAQSRLSEMEEELGSLHRERDEAQRAALALQSSLEQLTQEKQAEFRQNQELLQSFKEQASQSAAKMCELQSSLAACREELNCKLRQMEEVRGSYENELQKKSDKVASLQEKLHSAGLLCQSSTEQNLQLQLSLQQQESMLTESTARVSELEESQSLLQRQVSCLEKQLERTRASLQVEVNSKQDDAKMNEKNLQEMNQQNTELSRSISHLTSQIQVCQAELVTKESELESLRRDVATKTSHISGLEGSLQHTESQLHSKSNMAEDLEKKLHQCDVDRQSCAQRAQILEGQLQSVEGELANTLKQAQELKDALQRTQTISDERQAQLDKLTVQLSETQRELEERTHEFLDMDSAMKERQGELQQRANLLGQLDVAIRDHKQQMEMKVESLQQTLEAKEKELRDAQRELTDRNTKESQELSEQLCLCQQRLKKLLKELEISQYHCEAQTRDLEATKLQTKMTEARLCSLEEEFTLKEARCLQAEASLQSTVSALEQELQLEREQHSKELESLQETRGQLLKVSEQISSTMRSSQEQLNVRLQQTQAQLEEAKARYEQARAQLDQAKLELDRAQSRAGHLQTELDQSQARLLQSTTQLEQSRTLHERSSVQNGRLHAQLHQLAAELNQTRAQVAQLQTQLHASKQSMETSVDSLLIKESEVTRLQARISSWERAVDRRDLLTQTPPLPALPGFPDLPQPSRSTHLPPSSAKSLSIPLRSPSDAHSVDLRSPTNTRPCSSPPAHPEPTSAPHPDARQLTRDWLQGSDTDSSLDLPPSLKATLREALTTHPWESSSGSVSTFTDAADHSWQGLCAAEATAASDLSFNPLTYMTDRQEDPNAEASLERDGKDEPHRESRRESESTLVGQEEEEDEEMNMTSLTGMLKFVNQTLAMQQDPSVWGAPKSKQT